MNIVQNKEFMLNRSKADLSEGSVLVHPMQVAQQSTHNLLQMTHVNIGNLRYGSMAQSNDFDGPTSSLNQQAKPFDSSKP